MFDELPDAVVRSLSPTVQREEHLARLSALLGPEEAGRAFNDLLNFCEQEPVSLREACKGYGWMRAAGMQPSMRDMSNCVWLSRVHGGIFTEICGAAVEAFNGFAARLWGYGIPVDPEDVLGSLYSYVAAKRDVARRK